MSSTTPSPKPVLIVNDEEVFAAFLQHFPAARYTLLFAAGAAEAMALCETRSPRLMVVPLANGGADLVSALRAVDHAGSAMLGLTPAEGSVDTGGVDMTVPHSEADQIIEAARELLNERRQQPRVLVEFPVRIGEGGKGIAKDISNQSLVVETTDRVKAGATLSLEIHWGESPVSFTAKVDRVKPLGMGLQSAVLLIAKDDKETQDYLDEIIRRILEVEHYLWALEPGRPAIRGPVAWDLARRAEASLLKTAELGITKEKESEPAPACEEEEDPDEALSRRYELGKPRGRWGIGDVLEARHRLLDRPVLIKRLRSDLHEDDGARRRLEQEARLASTVSNDCIADVLDFGEDGCGLFYTLERLDGQTLAEALQARNPLFVTDILRLGVHLSFALAAAHKLGVLHLDLCPEHVFLHEQSSGQSVPKLLAFAGDSTKGGGPPPHARGLAFRPPGPARMSPDAHWDIYALARMLSRIQPTDASAESAARMIAILLRATASDETRRFDSMSAFCQALARVLRDAEEETGGDLGTRVVPVVLPEDFLNFRASSTGLIPTTSPPLQSPWPRTTVALSPSEVVEPAGVGVPEALDPTSRPAGDPFEDAPTYVADLSGAAPGTLPSLGGKPTLDQPTPDPKSPVLVVKPTRVGEELADDLDDDLDDDEPTTVAAPPDTSKAEAAAKAKAQADAKANADAQKRAAADAKAKPDAQKQAAADAKAKAAPAAASESSAPKPVAKVSLKKTTFGMPTAKPVPGKAVPAKAVPAKPVPSQPALTPPVGLKPAANSEAKPSPDGPDSAAALVEATLSEAVDPEFDEAPTDIQPVKDGKTLFGVPAAPRPVAPPGQSPVAPPPAAAPLSPGTPAMAAAPAPSTAEVIASAIESELQPAGVANPQAAVAHTDASQPLPELSTATAPVPEDDAMPLVAASPTPDLPAPGTGGAGKAVLIVVIALLVLGGGGAALWFFVLSGGEGKSSKSASSATAQADHDAMRPPPRERPRRRRIAAGKGATPDAGTPAPRAVPDAGTPAADAATPALDAAAAADTPDAEAKPDAAVRMTHAERIKFLRELRRKKKLEAKKRLKERLALINHARRYMRHGQYTESRKYLTAALKMWDSPRLRRLFSVTYSKVGQTWPAIYHQKKAVSQNSHSVSNQIRLGQLYLKVGQHARACMAFRAAKAAKPDDARAKKYVKRYCGG